MRPILLRHHLFHPAKSDGYKIAYPVKLSEQTPVVKSFKYRNSNTKK